MRILSRLFAMSAVVVMVGSFLSSPAFSADSDTRVRDVLSASEQSAGNGIDVIVRTKANKPTFLADGVSSVPAQTAIRMHTVIAADNSFYQSTRRNREKSLLGAKGYNSVQGNWATPSTLYRDARAAALIRDGRITATTAVIGLDAQWPYSTITPESAAIEGSNFPWYLTRTMLVPFNLATGAATITDYRLKRGSGGTSVITGRVEPTGEPDTDRCAARNLRIVVDSRGRVQESSWTQVCTQSGRTVSVRREAKAKYGPQTPKPAIEPTIPQSALLGGN
jgi:hypothetical protein